MKKQSVILFPNSLPKCPQQGGLGRTQNQKLRNQTWVFLKGDKDPVTSVITVVSLVLY